MPAGRKPEIVLDYARCVLVLEIWTGFGSQQSHGAIYSAVCNFVATRVLVDFAVGEVFNFLSASPSGFNWKTFFCKACVIKQLFADRKKSFRKFLAPRALKNLSTGSRGFFSLADELFSGHAGCIVP